MAEEEEEGKRGRERGLDEVNMWGGVGLITFFFLRLLHFT